MNWIDYFDLQLDLMPYSGLKMVQTPQTGNTQNSPYTMNKVKFKSLKFNLKYV